MFDSNRLGVSTPVGSNIAMPELSGYGSLANFGQGGAGAGLNGESDVLAAMGLGTGDWNTNNQLLPAGMNVGTGTGIDGRNNPFQFERKWGTWDKAQAGIGLAQGLGNMYLGYRGLGIAEDQLDFQKQAYAQNYDAQRTLTNRQLATNYSTAVEGRGGEQLPGYESLADYMSQNGIAERRGSDGAKKLGGG